MSPQFKNRHSVDSHPPFSYHLKIKIQSNAFIAIDGKVDLRDGKSLIRMAFASQGAIEAKRIFEKIIAIISITFQLFKIKFETQTPRMEPRSFSDGSVIV